MPSQADLKRLAWRAHHRGTKEADLLIGGFFDAYHGSWEAGECEQFAALLDEQDADILAWAHGTAEPPHQFAGRVLDAMKKLDYIRISR